MSIELVIQTPSGRIPVKAEPSTTLAQVVGAATIGNDNGESLTSLRYLQTSVHKSQWENMTLQNLGLASGARALLILESNVTSVNSSRSDTADIVMQDTSKDDDTAALKLALSKILNQNFDGDSQVCIVTLLKVLDNVLQKPGNVKVRTIRLSNATFSTKVVSKGGVDYLLASGFIRQTSAPELLSNNTAGEESLVLTSESTSHLIKARRLLMQTALVDLNMNADDLPKYKPPPSVSATTTTSTTSIGFNPYKSNRHNATGQPQQPDAYESTTETKLKQLQSRQERLEAQLQGQELENREIVALRPSEEANNNIIANNSSTTSSASAQPSDGALLAQRIKRLEQERKEREEGGFTTKAMRDLQKMKNAKVYSHAKLRLQFPDASALEAKFLPRETVETVKHVVRECLITPYEFDLYVAPPRRQLDVSQTLQQEGLVPAAKCFVSWKGGGPPSGSEFLKEHLFQSQAVAPSFPTAKPVVQEPKRKNGNDSKPAADAKPKKSSREEDLLARMMGGKGGGNSSKTKKASDDKKSDKPKWFKG